MTSTAPAAPTTTPTRITSLDVLRGVAILGTFASNVWLFAHPGGPTAWFAGGGPAPDVVETALRTLANGKFLALLTLLFGIGIELQYRSAVRRGSPWPGRYPVRAAILFVEGLLHYVLVFEFDVLMGYAVASLLVAYLVGRSDRVVHAWMAVVGGLYLLGIGAVTALLLVLPGGPAVPEPAVASTASWWEQVLVRLDSAGLYRIELVLIVPSATVLFLLGSRLLRAGALDDTPAGARIRRRLMLLGFGVGAPLNLVTAFAGPAWVLVDRYVLPPLVALGLLGLITGIVLRSRGGAPRRAVAAVGRTALSCYVLQNVLASVLCYDWGLGLATRFADARPWWVVGLWAVVSLALVLFATAWLRHFERGPLELLVQRVYARPPHAPAQPETSPVGDGHARC
ncbi:DUF418 domain-containing protein [Cellulomonas sp. 179-A 4D5 NHS]|uniref:DUF418 domain-containing protein n=1 Tax=Cellulomonas sp. 179-A 4D5 NHS TaxID=3142378 RepID=UPI0039A34D2D